MTIPEAIPVLADPSTSAVTQRPPRRLAPSLAVGNAALLMINGAVGSMLLPIQIQGIDEASKAGNLAIVTAIGALGGMIGQPVGGYLSDRTRSRFGKRGPWLLAGTVLGGLALFILATAGNSLLQTVIAWVAVQFTYALAVAPFSAILPDRFPKALRGVGSAALGLGLMFGVAGGTIVGTLFAKDLPLGYLVFGGSAFLAMAAFIVVNPERSNRDEPRDRFSIAELFSTFRFSRGLNRDFWLAFAGRFMMYTGYFAVIGYALYLLQDYVGLGDNAIGYVALLSGTSLLGTIAGIAVSGPLSDKFRRRKLFVIVGAVLYVIALTVPWAFPTIAGMIAFSVISGLGFGIYQSVDTALISEVLPDAKAHAKDLGIVNIASSVAHMVGPAIAGFTIVALGYVWLFPIAILVTAAGVGFVVLIKSVK